MPTIADFEELDLTGLNVDHVMPRRSILTADYGHGYKDTTRVGPVGGTRQFVLSAGVWPDDPIHAAIGSDSWMEYYTTFFDTRLDNANEPFIIEWRERKWLVDLDEPTYGVEVHTSDLFTPDGITLNLRRVSGLTNMPDGSVFDPTIVDGVYGWYLDGEDIASWVDQSGNGNDFTGLSGDVIGVPNVRNGHGVARFSSTTNDGKITSSLDATIYEAFIVMKMRESLFSNYAGILSGDAAPNNVMLVGGSGDTRFLDLSLAEYTYKKNGAEYSQSNQLAPMDELGVVHIKTTAGLAMTNLQLGCDRDFSGRFAEVDIGEIVLCDTSLTESDADRIETYLMTKWGIAPDVVTLPPVPTGLTLEVLSDTSIEASWDAGLDTTAPSVPTMAAGSVLSDSAIDWSWSAATDDTAVTGYDLQIAEDAGFSIGLVTHNLGNVLTYSSTGLDPSTIYYARVRAHDAVPNNSAYSSSVNATTDVGSFDPSDITGLYIWHDASQLTGLSDGDPVSSFTDYAGSSRHSTASGAQRPTYKTNIVNSLPVLRFDGTNNFLTTAVVSGLTEGEAFIVFKVDADPPGADLQSGFWGLGTDVTGTHLPYTNGLIYDSFGTSVRKDTAVSTGGVLDVGFHIYSAYSKASDWACYLDDPTTAIYSTGTNTVAFGTGGGGGGTGVIGSHGNTSYKLDGDIAEFILYNRKLTGPEREDVYAYLQGKYAI